MHGAARAIKLIKNSNLKPTWDKEIEKARLIGYRDFPVPMYEDYGDVTIDGISYKWIASEWIDGISVKKLINDRRMTIPILLSVIENSLKVFFRCKQIGIQHGDFHSGNIIIQEPSEISLNKEHKAYIIDFGYLSAAMGKAMLDDYKGLDIVIKDSLNSIPFSSCNGDEKKYYTVLKHHFSQDLLETNYTIGGHVRNPLELLKRIEIIKEELFRLKSPNSCEKHISDCLAAELMGERYDEWKELFVPEFLGRSEVLAKNPSVITGLRGCGKTTIFRRLSALFNCNLGELDLPEAHDFIGLYLNARNLAEAFPWLPKEQASEARGQIIKYFHLGWCLDIISWLNAEKTIKKRSISFEWLYDFFNSKLNTKIIYDSSESLLSLHNVLIDSLEKTRLHDKYCSIDKDGLTSLSFLEDLVLLLRKNCTWLGDKPFFFFFDDYSTPLIPEIFQKILNAVIFRRSANVIFKVATESVESFCSVGLNDKKLEENDDYVLIDFGSVHLLNQESENQKIISAIIEKRLERDVRLKKLNTSLKELLGESPLSYNELAKRLRTNQKTLYYGYKYFCAMWSCDIREIIRLFASMVDLLDPAFFTCKPQKIPEDIQDKAMRSAGAKYIALLSSSTNPLLESYEMESKDFKFYGEHLTKIAHAFHRIAKSELSKDVKNQEQIVPKQARRIEITESLTSIEEKKC